MVQTERETGALRGQFARQAAVQASAAAQAESAPEQALPPEPAQPAWQPETRLEQMAAELMGWFDAMMPQE